MSFFRRLLDSVWQIPERFSSCLSTPAVQRHNPKAYSSHPPSEATDAAGDILKKNNQSTSFNSSSKPHPLDQHWFFPFRSISCNLILSPKELEIAGLTTNRHLWVVFYPKRKVLVFYTFHQIPEASLIYSNGFDIFNLPIFDELFHVLNLCLSFGHSKQESGIAWKRFGSHFPIFLLLSKWMNKRRDRLGQVHIGFFFPALCFDQSGVCNFFQSVKWIDSIVVIHQFFGQGFEINQFRIEWRKETSTATRLSKSLIKWSPRKRLLIRIHQSPLSRIVFLASPHITNWTAGLR